MGAITGDFLFVGDVGRPDLLERSVHVAGSADSAARTLFRSLGRLRSYADYLQLWPGHSAGSACGKGLSAVPQSTLGFERRHNWALQIDDEEEFVAAVLGGQPEPPAYFSDMKRLNAQGSAACDETARPAHVSPDEVVQAIDRGAVVIDARSTEAYAAGHIPGTIHIPPDRSFLTWAGSVVPLSAEVLMIGDELQLVHAVADLALIGIDHVVGYAGPEVVAAWQQSGRPLESVRMVSVGDVARQARRGDVTVLDVRTAAERAQDHIAGSIHIPLPELCGRLDELDRGRPMIVHCQAGSRSAIATSVLLARGFSRVEDMRGGLNAWREAGHQVLTDSMP
jgi:hydroxyacylglutathione hydrolase